MTADRHLRSRCGPDTVFVINIDVDDLQAAEVFYSNAFGFRSGRRIGEDVLEMLGGPAPVYLLLAGAGTAAADSTAQRRDYARHWTPVHLDFVVDDIEAALARALRAGARLERDISRHAWGSLALLSDPFGHGFCLLRFEGGGYDEITRQIPDSPPAP